MDYVSHITLLASLAVVAVEQILKLNVVPVAFANRYPVLANVGLSIVASVVAVWRTTVAPHSWTDWLTLVATTSVVAAVTYNMTLKNWTQLRAMEGEGKAV